MTLHLPEDGFAYLLQLTASPVVLTVLTALILLLVVRGRWETRPLLTTTEASAPSDVSILTALGTALLAEGLLPAGPSGSLATVDLLVRNLLVILVGFDLIPRLLGRRPVVVSRLVGRIHPPGRLLLLGLLALAGLGLALWGLSVLQPLSVTIGPSPGSTEASVLMLGLGIVLQVLAVPATEEMVFRGGLYPWLRKRTGVAAGLIVTSGLFALLHAGSTPFSYTFVGALTMTLLYEAADSILPGLVVHGGMNFLLLYGGLLAP